MAKIAVLGFGTVGGGVAQVLEENRAAIATRLGEEVSLKCILVRHFRDCPWRDRMTDRLEDITGDPEIAVAVEVIGGVDAAYDYTRRRPRWPQRGTAHCAAPPAPEAPGPAPPPAACWR